MTTKTTIYIAIAVSGLFTLGLVLGSVWSDYKIKNLENAVEEAKQAAVESWRIAEDKEKETNIYKSKIEYLERQIADSRAAARRQDEKLKTQTTNTAGSRRDVERARGVRTIDTNINDLCAKLAGLGHSCR